MEVNEAAVEEGGKTEEELYFLTEILTSPTKRWGRWSVEQDMFVNFTISAAHQQEIASSRSD